MTTQLALTYPVGRTPEALYLWSTKLVDTLKAALQGDAADINTVLAELQTALTQAQADIDAAQADILTLEGILPGGALTPQQAFELALVTQVRTVLGSVSNLVLQTIEENEKAAEALLRSLREGIANTASIRIEQTARLTESEAFVQQIETLMADIASTNAAIVTEQTARADGDSALASQISTVSASVAGNTASITTLTSVTNGQSASISGLSTDLTSLNASVSSLNGVVSSQGTSISGLNSSVSGLSTTVSSQGTAITNAQNSIDAISARWGVAINVNGHVTGLIQLSGGSSSTEFTVVADKFVVAHPSTGTPNAVFALQTVGGVASQMALKGDFFADGLIAARMVAAGAITADKIAANSVTADKLSVTSLSAITAKIGVATAGKIQSTDGKFVIDLDNKILRMSNT